MPTIAVEAFVIGIVGGVIIWSLWELFKVDKWLSKRFNKKRQ